MKLPKSITPNKHRGYALHVTLAFLFVALITFASLMNWAATNAKLTKRNILLTQSQAAAESATEIIIGTMTRDFFNQGLNPPSAYNGTACLPTQTNWPITFRFSDTNGTANASSVIPGAVTTNSGNLPAQFSSLCVTGQYYDIYSCATPKNVGDNLTAMVHQQLWFGNTPIFQYAVFYNPDMEIAPCQDMTINGPVHCNNNIYACGCVDPSIGVCHLTFSDIVEAAQTFYPTPNPLDCLCPINSWNGNLNFNKTTNNPLCHAQVLSLPIGTNNDPVTARGILGLPPAGTDPASSAGQAYPYNQADIIVSNSPNGTLSVYYQNLNKVSTQTLVPKDMTNYYSFVTNVTFYDYRESKTVYAVQLDVHNFNTWLTNANAGGGQFYQNQNNTTGCSTSKGHDINAVYVYNAIPLCPSSFPGDPNGKLPAVRLVNGYQLPPAGLTVATPMPLYVQDHYNVTTNLYIYQPTGCVATNAWPGTSGKTCFTPSWSPCDTTNTYPAALMGDAITVLSASWKDTYSPFLCSMSRVASGNITINAACLEGIVPSKLPNISSGGVQNCIRLLEDWSCGKTLTCNGSIVVLFPSQFATCPFQPCGIGCGIFSPPKLNLALDKNFSDPNKPMPPMTPQLRVFARTLWSSTQ